MGYNFNVRNAANTAWVDMLQAQFSKVLDSNSKFTATNVEDALEELFDNKVQRIETTSSPGASDDTYQIGSLWVNTTTDVAYICTDNASGAANWIDVSSIEVEEIEDIVGAMVTGNTETNISVTYNDDGTNNGKLDFVVATADASTLGVASFDNTNFLVTAGDVTIAADGVSVTELAHNIDATGIGFNADQVDGTDVNDSGTTTSDLWTASKIVAYVDSLAGGLSWQEPVIDKDMDTPPGTPATGDRYIISASPQAPSGAWAGEDNNVAEWNGTSWDFTTTTEGFACWVEDEDSQYVFNATSWVKLGTTVTHNNLGGLQGGAVDDYYHLTNTELSAVTGSKTANYVYAAPDGSGGTPDFRALVSDDIPSLTASKITDFDEAAQDAVGAAITAGTFTNMTLTYQDSGNTISGSVATATSAVLGVASFDNSDFNVSSGHVTINAGGVEHGSLAGLGDDDHTQYVHVSTNRTITATHTFNPGSAGAPFSLGANASGQLVTGFNADLVDGHHWSVAATASAPSSPSTNDIWVEITA